LKRTSKFIDSLDGFLCMIVLYLAHHFCSWMSFNSNPKISQWLFTWMFNFDDTFQAQYHTNLSDTVPYKPFRHSTIQTFQAQYNINLSDTVPYKPFRHSTIHTFQTQYHINLSDTVPYKPFRHSTT
jgi:hypothetical protein